MESCLLFLAAEVKVPQHPGQNQRESHEQANPTATPFGDATRRLRVHGAWGPDVERSHVVQFAWLSSVLTGFSALDTCVS